MDIKITAERFSLAEVFTISRGSRSETNVITVRLERNGIVGWGECLPYARYAETQDSVTAQIESIRQELLNNPSQEDLQSLLPAGAARNAVDCALWDLSAKEQGKPVWQLAELGKPAAITTAYTLSLAEPQQMHDKAVQHAHRPLLKLKLGGEGDLARLQAVRRGAPNTDIIIDANEGWTPSDYQALAPELLALGVKMVEQPFAAASDDALASMERPLPVCADESCHDTTSLQGLVGKYDMINIKLDKTGGLTEALNVRRQAESMGFQLMVGCMVGTSLAIAPAVLLSQGIDMIDLDAPMLLAEDRPTPLAFEGSVIQPADPLLWG